MFRFPSCLKKRLQQSVWLDQDPEEGLAPPLTWRRTCCFPGPCLAFASLAFESFCAPTPSVAPQCPGKASRMGPSPSLLPHVPPDGLNAGPSTSPWALARAAGHVPAQPGGAPIRHSFLLLPSPFHVCSGWAVILPSNVSSPRTCVRVCCGLTAELALPRAGHEAVVNILRMHG